MYLAQRHIGNQTHYDIRESYLEDGCWLSRPLFDLGSDPARYIIYPGGRGYYYDEAILDALSANGCEADQTDLDDVFFDFLDPQIQRVIDGFDRRHNHTKHKDHERLGHAGRTIHMFDKRRFFFLRFGPKTRQSIQRIPQKIFSKLNCKSRDELEQYFLKEELTLNQREKPLYVATIFELNRFLLDSEDVRDAQTQLDEYFISKLCRLDQHSQFWRGVPQYDRLQEYLIKYVIMYFDYEHPRQDHTHRYFQEFINRHRSYTAPPHIRSKIKAAERIFNLSWDELRKMSRQSLSRHYRRLSLKHHPDHGGDPSQFNLLTQIYRQLLKNKPSK